MWPRVGGLRSIELGTPGGMRAELNALLLAGWRTATGGLLSEDEQEGEQLEHVGERFALLDEDHRRDWAAAGAPVVDATPVGCLRFRLVWRCVGRCWTWPRHPRAGSIRVLRMTIHRVHPAPRGRPRCAVDESPTPPRRPTEPPGKTQPPGSQDPNDLAAPGSGLPPALDRSHPPGTAGPYAVTGPLRELVFTRAPLCEFPGCGVKAERCDAEHDLAHPDGPTCACNLGPCCRSHHRVKQQGWTKTRPADSGVLWTSPTGRGRFSPSQHQPPQAPVRALPPLSSADPLDELSPTFADDELWRLLDRPDDPAAYELRALDTEPDDAAPDPVAADTRWTLDLTDPYAWDDARPV